MVLADTRNVSLVIARVPGKARAAAAPLKNELTYLLNLVNVPTIDKLTCRTDRSLQSVTRPAGGAPSMAAESLHIGHGISTRGLVWSAGSLHAVSTLGSALAQARRAQPTQPHPLRPCYRPFRQPGGLSLPVVASVLSSEARGGRWHEADGRVWRPDDTLVSKKRGDYRVEADLVAA